MMVLPHFSLFAIFSHRGGRPCSDISGGVSFYLLLFGLTDYDGYGLTGYRWMEWGGIARVSYFAFYSVSGLYVSWYS